MDMSTNQNTILAIEAEVFGKSLDNLDNPELVLGMTLGRFRKKHWQGETFEDREANYSMACSTFFTRTKEALDWGPKSKLWRGVHYFPSSVGYKASDVMALNLMSLTQSIPDHPDEADYYDLHFEALMLIYVLRKSKALHYGNSWRKRGHGGVFHNLGRKWDRIEVLFEANAQGNNLREDMSTGEESIIHTLIDLANYAVMWTTHLAKTHPEMYDEWKKFVVREAQKIAKGNHEEE